MREGVEVGLRLGQVEEKVSSARSEREGRLINTTELQLVQQKRECSTSDEWLMKMRFRVADSLD